MSSEPYEVSLSLIKYYTGNEGKLVNFESNQLLSLVQLYFKKLLCAILYVLNKMVISYFWNILWSIETKICLEIYYLQNFQLINKRQNQILPCWNNNTYFRSIIITKSEFMAAHAVWFRYHINLFPALYRCKLCLGNTVSQYFWNKQCVFTILVYNIPLALTLSLSVQLANSIPLRRLYSWAPKISLIFLGRIILNFLHVSFPQSKRLSFFFPP